MATRTKKAGTKGLKPLELTAKERAAKGPPRGKKSGKSKKKLARRKNRKSVHYDRWAYLRNDVARVVLLNVPEISGSDAFRIGQMICEEAERARPKKTAKKPVRVRGRRLFGLSTEATVFEILGDSFAVFLEAYGATDPAFKSTPDKVVLAAWAKWAGLMKTPKIGKVKRKKDETDGERRLRIVQGDGEPVFEVLHLASAIMIGGARAARSLQGGQAVAPDAKTAYQFALVCRSVILTSIPRAGVDYPAAAENETPDSAAATTARQDIAEEAFDFARESFGEALQHGQQVKSFITLSPSSSLVRSDIVSLWKRWLELLRHRIEERYKAHAHRVVRRVRKLAKRKAKGRAS